MYGDEKPKRQTHFETEESVERGYRNFYWRLLFMLMIPAFILGSLFMLPVVLVVNRSNDVESITVDNHSGNHVTPENKAINNPASEDGLALNTAIPQSNPNDTECFDSSENQQISRDAINDIANHFGQDATELWKGLLQDDRAYPFLAVNCGLVIFHKESIIIFKGQSLSITNKDAEISRWEFPECDEIRTLTAVGAVVTITCQNGYVQHVEIPFD